MSSSFVLALLSRVGDGPRGRRGPDTLKEGLEAVDDNSRAAARLTRQREGVLVGVGARAGVHSEGTVPPRALLTNVGGVEQLLGPRQHAVADLGYRVDTARIELRLPVGLRSREQLRTVASIARSRCA